MVELELLAQLRDQGIVSEEEFAAKKKHLLRIYTGQSLRPGASLLSITSLDLAGAVVELEVQVERRVDECEGAERLREVTQLLACQPDLLGVETEVVGVRAQYRFHPPGRRAS